MRKDVWLAAIRNGKLARSREWLGDLVGLWLVSGFWFSCIFLLFQKDGEVGNRIGMLCLAASSLPVYAIYCLQQENNLTSVESGLGINGNRKLVASAFQELEWTISTNTTNVITAEVNGKWYVGARQTATALIDHNKVYLNIIHHGTVKGRLPFNFGLNPRKLNQIIEKIRGLQIQPENQHFTK